MTKKPNYTASAEKNFYRSWIENINSQMTPSPEENLELIQKYQNGDELAFEELLNRNKRLIIYCARFIASNESLLEDLVQAGSIALEKAAKTYKPGISSFAYYAIPIIKTEMYRTANQNRSGFSLPIEFYQKLHLFKNQINDELDDESLCESLRVTKSTLERLKDYKKYDVYSLDALENEDYASSEEDNSPSAYLETLSETDLLFLLKETLTPKMYYILYYRVFFGKTITQEKISTTLGCQKQAVSHSEQQLKNKLKKILSSKTFLTCPEIIENPNINPIKPAHIIDYLYLRNYLSSTDKYLYKSIIFGRQKHSYKYYAEQLGLSIDQIISHIRKLKEMIQFAKRVQNGEPYKASYQKLITEYQSYIYDIDIDSFELPSELNPFSIEKTKRSI